MGSGKLCGIHRFSPSAIFSQMRVDSLIQRARVLYEILSGLAKMDFNFSKYCFDKI